MIVRALLDGLATALGPKLLPQHSFSIFEGLMMMET